MLMNRMLGICSRIAQILNRRMKQELSLTLAKYEVLLAVSLSEDSEITMGNLSRELSVSNANITGMIARLRKERLVRKKALPSDRRVYSVSLTDEGREMLEKAVEKRELWISELMANIKNDDITFMNTVFDKIVL